MKYVFFYPENGERFPLPLEFDTVEEAVNYWTDKRSTWQQVEPQNEQDKAAFLNPRMGSMVVVREVGDR